MSRWSQTSLAVGLAVTGLAGLVFVSTALAQQNPPDRSGLQERCRAALPQQTVEPILAKYRDRMRSAREAAVKEERALRSLLVADTTTRAALDAQIARTNEARNALTRVRLDLLWELRSAIPAQDREIAFRCAERMLMRGR